ncbi:MAG: helix-turn-helix transcriptional regulator [Bacteroidaceae bacterium]|nr:helix-turn-helix transcriptional regulator [Bacteroidaceae bacterium]
MISKNYHTTHLFRPTDLMAELINRQYSLLQIVSRFGMSLGVGEKSVSEVCREHNVDCSTFLAVINYVGNGCRQDFIPEPETISLPSLLKYLRESHTYFLEYSLPSIRRKLIGTVNYSSSNEFPLLILKYYDSFFEEVRAHLDYENKTVFPHVDALLTHHPSSFTIDAFDTEHDETADGKLNELKNIIIRYYSAPSVSNYALNDVLSDIFICNEELNAHGLVEENLFLPAVKLLEERASEENESIPCCEEGISDASLLSPREKEIVIGVVKGLTNKEIADKLYISLNTVLTHRRNIARKLEIHSPAGLTIYAIVNGLVKIEELE